MTIIENTNSNIYAAYDLGGVVPVVAWALSTNGLAAMVVTTGGLRAADSPQAVDQHSPCLDGFGGIFGYDRHADAEFLRLLCSRGWYWTAETVEQTMVAPLITAAEARAASYRGLAGITYITTTTQGEER